MTAVLLSDGGLIGVPQDAEPLDPEVLQTRAIFDAARAGLLASVSGSREAIDLAEAQRLLDALAAARMLAQDAEDRVLLQRSLLSSAEAERRAIARRAVARRASAAEPADDGFEQLGACVIRLRPVRSTALPAASRGAATVLVRAVLPAAAALAGAAVARRSRQR